MKLTYKELIEGNMSSQGRWNNGRFNYGFQHRTTTNEPATKNAKFKPLRTIANEPIHEPTESEIRTRESIKKIQELAQKQRATRDKNEKERLEKEIAKIQSIMWEK